MTASERHNAKVSGAGERAIVFAHGFGCDQNMWRLVAPAFERDFRVVLFDHVGAGGSDLSAYDPAKYGSLDGYADDVVELCRDLGIRGGVFVGHSVSAMIGVLAAKRAPELFDDLVLVGPSPRYIDDERLRRRLQRGAGPRAARLPRQQPHGLVAARWRRRSWATPTAQSSPRN